MDPHAQYWHAHTPWQVRLLSVFLLIVVVIAVGVVWHHWGLSVGWYSGLAIVALGASGWAAWSYATTTITANTPTLCFDSINGFGLLDELDDHLPITIQRVWHSPFTVSLRVHYSDNEQSEQNEQNHYQHLVFWRGALTAERWRKLHIYLWYYQLHYQFADLKAGHESRT